MRATRDWMQLTIDYAVPNLTLKSKMALTANPTVDIAATTGYKGGVFGVSGVYDSKAGELSSWTAAAGYTALDYQVRMSIPPFPCWCRCMSAALNQHSRNTTTGWV
jgi:hypothetical protein